MPGPDSQPPTPARRPRGPSSLAVRNGCVWLVLILLIAAVVVQTVATAHPHGWSGLTGRAPHAVVNALIHAVVAIALAVLLHALLRRSAVWAVLAVTLVALYPAASRWWDGGRAPTHVWMWVPFVILLSLAAMHAIPRALREAAAVDRAGPWFAFRTITLPLAAPLLVVGSAFLVAVAIQPVDTRGFVVAHVVLILAILVDALLSRSRP
jgi:ABC-type sugar transport system permease subunit